MLTEQMGLRRSCLLYLESQLRWTSGGCSEHCVKKDSEAASDLLGNSAVTGRQCLPHRLGAGSDSLNSCIFQLQFRSHGRILSRKMIEPGLQVGEIICTLIDSGKK